MPTTTAPIVIDDSNDDDYVPPNYRKSKSKRKQSSCMASPAKRRIKVERESDSFMTTAQATTSTSRKNQPQITQFFASPGKKPICQPSLTSFLSGKPTIFSPPRGIQVVLPEPDSEPLAPLPDPFTFRTLCPSPPISEDTLSSRSSPTINSEAVKIALQRSYSEVAESLSNPAPTPAGSPSQKSVAVRSTQNTLPFGSINKRFWAAAPTIRRELPNSSPQTPIPSVVLSYHGLVYKTPRPDSSSFISRFKVVATQPRVNPRTLPSTEPVMQNKSLGSASKPPCKCCNNTFMVTPSTATNSVSGGSPCPVCASKCISLSAVPSSARDGGVGEERLLDVEGRPPNAKVNLAPTQHRNVASSVGLGTVADAVPGDGRICNGRDIRPDIILKSPFFTGARPVKPVSLETTPTHTGAKSPARKMKLYTPESMAGNSLKSVQDMQETPEDECKRLNARRKKAEYRARRKVAVAASPPPEPISPPMIRATTTALSQEETASTLPQAEPPITRATTMAPAVISQRGIVSRKVQKRRKIIVTTPRECKVHNDPDCADEGCAPDFFEDYDPFNETTDVRSGPRRTLHGTDRPLSKHTTPEQRTVLGTPSAESLREVELALSLVARDDWQRRPYMSNKVREFLRHMGGWSAFSNHVDCIIHVDFTPAEAETLRYCISNGQRALHGMPIDQQIGLHATKLIGWRNEASRFLHSLPGRIESDVVAFIEECEAAFINHKSRPLGHSIIRIPGPPKPTSRSLPESTLRLLREAGRGLVSRGGLREPGHALELKIRDSMPAWKIFTDGSSDVLDICWSPDGQRFGLSCCTYDDQYNRPGNLMLGSLDSMKIRMLEGHKVSRPNTQQAVLDSFLYSTVSSIKYSRDGRLLLSGSYDKTVKIWLGEDGTPLNSVNLGSEVSQLATSPIHPQLIAAGCKDGNVSVLSIDQNENLESNPVVLRPAKPGLEAAALAWCSNIKPNWLIAGYDSQLEKSSFGDLLIFDIQAEKIVSNVMPGSTRQFDVFHDENSAMFAAAAFTSSRRSNRHIKTQIRLYSLADDAGKNARATHEFESEQSDINRVTVSPCETYVTASGTDGSTTAWDRRYPNTVLHILKHGESLMVPRIDGNPEIDDTGITCSLWGPSNDRFYTGGSDGVVKIWDIKRGDPFVRDFATLDSQIMSGAFSPAYDMLIIGECSGQATLFSTQGDRRVAPGLFEVDMSDATGESEENEETGAEAARALVESGKIVVKGHFAWATGC